MIHFRNPDRKILAEARDSFLRLLDNLQLGQFVRTVESGQSPQHGIVFGLVAALAMSLAPEFDTLQLGAQLGLDIFGRKEDLYREILLAMLLGPVPFVFPDCNELQSALRVRGNIVRAAHRTELDFSTEGIARPTAYWKHDEDAGFTLLPGKSLVEALRNTLLPEESGRRYAFSCYRATEYVALLGIAEELHAHNHILYSDLETLWRQRALMSAEFQETLLREYGSLQAPLPAKYYVPGDRVWFRNPDEPSSNATGYEGSWLFYLGNGLFNNFWKKGNEYTLRDKCIEIYHWRNGTYTDAKGELQMDEAKVEALVAETQGNPVAAERILSQMMRLREPQGVYRSGGCIDASREFPRRLCRETSDIHLHEQFA